MSAINENLKRMTTLLMAYIHVIFFVAGVLVVLAAIFITYDTFTFMMTLGAILVVLGLLLKT